MAKKKIAILGSTGSIGKSLLNIIYKNKEKFEVVLLTANNDYKTLEKQAKKFNAKNLIITDLKSYEILNKKKYKSKFKLYNKFNAFKKIFNSKIDYVMSSIVGIEGLEPTLKIIKFTKKIAIANKESIICGWNLINSELSKNNTNFIPVDSEHFSLWYGMQNLNKSSIDKIYITASGGPFIKTPLKKFDKITSEEAIKHPNWKMGKKISIDSATMINKVYEVIEAKNIFNLPFNKINILIHPKSYIHAILKFNNGLIKLIAHKTTMEIPIYNTLNFNFISKINSREIDLENLNNLNLTEVDTKRFPIVNILKNLPSNNSLYYTIIVSANDTLVDLFLKNKIKFKDIHKIFLKFSKNKEFQKYKKKYPLKVEDILNLSEYVRLKIQKKVYKSKNV